MSKKRLYRIVTMSTLPMPDDIESSILQAIKTDDHFQLEDLLQLLESDTTSQVEPDLILSHALIDAANQGRVEATSILLRHGADRVIDYTNDYGNTALIMAAIRSHGEIMTCLIQGGCSVNKTDQEARLALHWTAMNGNLKLTEELLENGSASDQPDKIYRFTPLMLAARRGHTGIVETLLRYECDVNRVDMHGETPLFDAVRNNNRECMKLLIKAGANINQLDRQGLTPMHVAVTYYRIKALQLLIFHNCQLDLGMRSAGLIGERYSAFEIALMESLEVPCEILYVAGASLRNLRTFLTVPEDSTFSSGKPVIEWVREILAQLPRTLKQLARIQIRKFYGTQLNEILDRLPLPQALRLYLQIPEVWECPNVKPDHAGGSEHQWKPTFYI